MANRQPSAAAVTASRSSGSATRFTSAWSRATSSANEPQRVKPGWVCRSHTWWSPARQDGQRPQAQTNGTVTRSPTRQSRDARRPARRPSRPARARARAAGRCRGRGRPSRASRCGTARWPRPGPRRRAPPAPGRAPRGPSRGRRTRRTPVRARMLPGSRPEGSPAVADGRFGRAGSGVDRGAFGQPPLTVAPHLTYGVTGSARGHNQPRGPCARTRARPPPPRPAPGSEP